MPFIRQEKVFVLKQMTCLMTLNLNALYQTKESTHLNTNNKREWKEDNDQEVGKGCQDNRAEATAFLALAGCNTQKQQHVYILCTLSHCACVRACVHVCVHVFFTMFCMIMFINVFGLFALYK